MSGEQTKDIIRKLKSGKTNIINEALLDIRKLWEMHIDEKWRRSQGNAATRTIGFLCDEFIEMSKSNKWLLRYTALRGLKAIFFSDAFEEKIEKMLEIFF